MLDTQFTGAARSSSGADYSSRLLPQVSRSEPGRNGCAVIYARFFFGTAAKPRL
jgi:hypothetical protein